MKCNMKGNCHCKIQIGPDVVTWLYSRGLTMCANHFPPSLQVSVLTFWSLRRRRKKKKTSLTWKTCECTDVCAWVELHKGGAGWSATTRKPGRRGRKEANLPPREAKLTFWLRVSEEAQFWQGLVVLKSWKKICFNKKQEGKPEEQ